MPLPQALLDRLKNRGIIRQEPSNEPHLDQEEEVIAEDYDEPIKSTGFTESFVGVTKGLVVTGCPNKYNIYHDCGDFCRKKWGSGKSTPSPGTTRKYQRLLKRYPLPEGWQDVWEPGIACYYFWNTSNDEVSWLPPTHPKAKVTVSAAKFRAMMRENDSDEDRSENEDDDDDHEEGDSDGDSDGKQASGTSSGSSSDIDSGSDSEPERKKPKASPRKGPSFFPAKAGPSSKGPFSDRQRPYDYGRDRGRGRGSGRAANKNDLDPMDPSSYSDTCPRGKWSDGLEVRGEAKSGVDPTAAGPLFQMRPYPNPGAVLRMNQQKPDDDDDD
jgi:polyglutamine-binding protein 1